MVALKHNELVATEEFSIDAIANKVARLNFEKSKRGTGQVEARSTAAASESHTYPMSDFKSRKKLPRPCRHCGSALHWDNDCPPHKADRTKSGHRDQDSPSKLEHSYRKAYAALVEGQEAEFAVAYTEFCTLSDSDPTDVLDVESPEEMPDAYLAALRSLVKRSSSVQPRLWVSV